MPLFSGERVLPPCRRMALSPLSWRRPGHYSAGGAAATAVWREYRPTAGALAAVGFPRRMGAVQRRDRCARAGLQYHDSARARRRQFRSLATCNALPARGRLCSTRRVGSGRAALRGRQRPLLARWIPAESASRGQQWTPAAGGDRAQIIVRRDDILQLSRCTLPARRGPAEKYRDTRGRQWDIIPG